MWLELYNRMQMSQYVNDAIRHYQSPHTRGYPLVDRPGTVLALTAGYIVLSANAQRIMSKRAAFEIRGIVKVYNLFMVVVNAFLFYEYCASAWGWNWICEPFDGRPTANNIRHGWTLYLFFLSKLIEFADTVFFMLRKKFDNISFLHVYHHSSMTLYSWYIVITSANGDVFVAGMINSLVHVVMYSYYFVAALGPQYHKYLWWKRHLTKMQILQFVIIAYKSVRSLQVNCNPPWYNYQHVIMILYMLTFIVLFGNFYRQSYRKRAGNKPNNTPGMQELPDNHAHNKQQ